MGLDLETLIILAVLAFILFGPEKLPQYAAKLGYYLAKLREASSELTKEAQASFNNPLQPPPAQPAAGEATCPLCTQKVGADFTFCPKCGHRLKEAAAAPVPNPPLAS